MEKVMRDAAHSDCSTSINNKSYLQQVTMRAMMRIRSSAPPAGDTTTAMSL